MRYGWDGVLVSGGSKGPEEERGREMGGWKRCETVLNTGDKIRFFVMNSGSTYVYVHYDFDDKIQAQALFEHEKCFKNQFHAFENSYLNVQFQIKEVRVIFSRSNSLT